MSELTDEQIRDHLSKIDEKLQPLIEERDELSEIKINREVGHLVGKYFRYRNSYSCSEKASDYWYTYAHAARFEGRCAHGLMFQTDSQGRHTADPEYYFYPANNDMGWDEVSDANWALARAHFITDVNMTVMSR